jgi:Zn-dependent metalloprotease
MAAKSTSVRKRRKGLASGSKRAVTPSPRPGNGLKTFSMHSSDATSAPLVAKLRAERPRTLSFSSATEALPKVDPETAARRYLQQALDSKSVKSFNAPQANGTVSEFKSLGAVTVPLTGTKVVKYRQSYFGIPVYGSLVTVELDDQNELVSLNSSLGQPDGVNPVAKISPDAALKAIAKAPGYSKDLAAIVPKLYFYFDRPKAKWRLVFIAEDVPVRRKADDVSPFFMDYVVDAHTGALVAELPRTPSLAAIQETAKDGKGTDRQFQVENNGGGSKLLQDTQAHIQTFDFRFNDPQVNGSALPGKPIRNPPGPWPPAAVSAHANAAAVAAFLRTVLMRNNIDDNGGPMNSSINCVVARESDDGRIWLNAFWNGTQMVYGQTRDAKGDLISLSVDLDVVGHEMFHGVTDSTARLEYANQSGALNESYSDIFGAIIANLDKPNVDSWNWNIGEGMNVGGKPFRNMQDPARFGQPANMKSFRKLPNTARGDWGGVHVNSGIHNKCAFLMLTARDGAGAPVLTPPDVAAIFYLSLTQQLSRTSQFSDSRRGVLLSARTFFRQLPPPEQNAKIDAITNAFDTVGIK